MWSLEQYYNTWFQWILTFTVTFVVRCLSFKLNITTCQPKTSRKTFCTHSTSKLFSCLLKFLFLSIPISHIWKQLISIWPTITQCLLFSFVLMPLKRKKFYLPHCMKTLKYNTINHLPTFFCLEIWKLSELYLECPQTDRYRPEWCCGETRRGQMLGTFLFVRCYWTGQLG